MPASVDTLSELRMPNDIDSLWMPFTANRNFKANPRMIVSAKDMHYVDSTGRKVLDGSAGLWCVNAGHGREPIIRAIQEQIARMDFAPIFQFGHPAAFELASRLTAMAPGGAYDRVFFTNSGSESCDTALKIALAYHRARGEAGRTRLIGRERGYHGVGFGGMSVGGIGNNRKQFGAMLPGVDHLVHTHDLQRNAFSRGQPEWGAHLADDLERLVALHDASTIAAVIVEPVAGSTGVLVPPRGYLQRLREICDRHGILLIFDEVITGFGRTGRAFAAETFNVLPDIITMAKGLTNGNVPMGAVYLRSGIYDALMDAPDNAIELFHGYTYSAHPLACAAALATLDLYVEEDLFARSAALSEHFESVLHGLRGVPGVVDIRNLGLMCGIELEPWPGRPSARAFAAFQKCWEYGMMCRYVGETLCVSPPLIAERSHVDEIAQILDRVIREVG